MSKITQRFMIGAALAVMAAAPLAAQTQYGQGQRGDRGGATQPAPPQAAAPQTPAQAVQQAVIQAIGGNVLVIYPDSNFRGPGTTVNQSSDRSNIEFESARVRGGWQLCENFNFGGRCVSVSSDFTNITTLGLSRVGSYRPLGIVPPPPPPPGERGDNANLRGGTAAFYPRPSERGFRIEIDDRRGGPGRDRDFDRDRGYGNGNGNRVEREANQFCRSMNFSEARYQTTETIRGRTYLADVLCVGTRR